MSEIKSQKEVKIVTGRPSKYNSEMPSNLISFFDRDLYTYDEEGNKVPSKMPTVERWCCDTDIVTSTFYLWVKEHKEFSSAFSKAKAYQKDHLINMGLMGIYKEGFAKFVAINCTDMRDRIEHNVDKSTIRISIDKKDSEL